MPERRGIRRALIAILTVGVAALAGAPGASAAEQQAYAVAMNYATPTITIGQGDTLTFTNLDNLAKHDIVGHDGAFQSDLIGGGESGPVRGVENLQPGQYQFHCSLHSWMQGVLNVGPPGSGPTQPDANSVQSGNPAASSAPDPYDIWPRAAKASIGNAAWPFYGKDLANSRDGGGDGPSPSDVPNLGVAWSFHSGAGDFTGTPIVAKGMVFAGAFEGHVYALEAATGRQRWANHIGKPINGTLATDGKRVYVPVAQVHHPFIQALDLKTGRTLWRAEIDAQKDADTFGSPVVWNGTVYQGASAEFGEVSDSQVAVRGEVAAFNAKNGKLKWRTYTVPPGHDGGAVWSTPAIDPASGRLYVGTGNAYHAPAADTVDSILQLDARTGRLINHFQATPGDVWNETDNVTAGPDYDFGSSPQLFGTPDGRRVVGEAQKSGTYWAVDPSNMQPVWSTLVGPGLPSIGGVIGSTATDGHGIFGPVTAGGEEWGLNTDGSNRWFSADGGPLKFGATSVANGVVYTNDMNGSLIARDAATGLVLARIPTGNPSWGGVSIAGGSIFVATGTQGTSGYIAAYRVRTDVQETGPADHWQEQPEPNPDEYLAQQEREKKCKAVNKRMKRAKSRAARRKLHRQQKRYCKKEKSQLDQGDDEDANGQQSQHQHDQGEGGAVLKANRQHGDRYVPKPPGTVDHLSLYYGPYTMPPGWDMNRVDLELPTENGFLMSIEPAMRRVSDLSEPGHQEAHIHHAHWFGFDPGNQEDNYFNMFGPGTHEWVFGNGDEETRADFTRRSQADPNGPVYGNFIPAGRNQTVIYMLHNKTNQPMEVYIVLDVIFEHGTRQQLEEIHHRPYHDVSGMLMGRTFNVPRQASGDGKWEYARDAKNSDGSQRVIEWTAPRDGTIIGTGGHLHPGGKQVIMENYGPKESPCPDDHRGYGGTQLLHSDVIDHNAPLSEDYQTEVTHPGWRAPLHKGDRIRISGTYENKDHAWYYVMTHAGFYIDYEQPPQGRCKPYIVGPSAKKVKDPTAGVPNRAWGKHTDEWCGEQYGAPPCEKPEPLPSEDTFVNQSVVHIANFQYLPGDRSSGASGGKIPSVPQGQQITFLNDDELANIRHTVTTCRWPCNGRYVANYPLADGWWDSDTLGYDLIDGGTPNPRAQTPPDLPPGLYTYFCRIHPWMRGAFRIEPPGGGSVGPQLGAPPG